MSAIKLIVPLSDLYISEGKYPKIHGTIFFEARDFKFPDDKWDDFVVKILGWWIENLSKAYRDREQQTKLLFMDGPVEVRVLFENDTCHMRFIRRWSDTHDILGEVTLTYNDLIANIIDIAQRVIAKAEQNKWQTRDLETLKHLVKSEL